MKLIIDYFCLNPMRLVYKVYYMFHCDAHIVDMILVFLKFLIYTLHLFICCCDTFISPSGINKVDLVSPAEMLN